MKDFEIDNIDNMEKLIASLYYVGIDDDAKKAERIEEISADIICDLGMFGSDSWQESPEYRDLMAPIIANITPEIISHITIEPLQKWLYDAIRFN